MENVLEPKEAFNLFRVPTKLENIVTALMVSIISNDKKRMNEAIETADFFALELTANEIELAKSYVVKILNHIRKINGLTPMRGYENA
tara:strand:+ start:144 stop:407 length:264 start_codon:yes stop_codon:yes gene_type:complete